MFINPAHGRDGPITGGLPLFPGGHTRWWARQDSNLQPDGYEPPALTIELRARPRAAGPIADAAQRRKQRTPFPTLPQLPVITRRSSLQLSMPMTLPNPDPNPMPDPARTVSVSATGTVNAEPDLARISTGIVAEGGTAFEALTKCSAAMRSLLEMVKALEIADRDLQTAETAIEPRYQHFQDGRPPLIDGYRVINQVRITVRKLASLGQVLDACVTAGANQMGGIQFEVSQAEPLSDEARRRAMEMALRRATLYAQAGGAMLGRVLTISETPPRPAPRPMGGMPRAAMAEAVPVEAGSQVLEATVHVTWALE